MIILIWLADLLTALTLVPTDLVPNGSFEARVACPQRISQAGLARPWRSVGPTAAGADYFHTCGARRVALPRNFAGEQWPRTGDACAGLFVYNPAAPAYREYLRVRLRAPLRAGQLYEAVCYLSRADFRTLAVGGWGMLFSGDTLPNLPAARPQVHAPPDSLWTDPFGWSRLRGRFYATGVETTLTIGLFPADTVRYAAQPSAYRRALLGYNPPARATAYYFVDDVSVYPVAD